METRQLSHLVRAMVQPLCIERQTLEGLVRVFRKKQLEGAQFDCADLHAELEIASPRTRGNREPGLVAVIPIVGVIANRMQSLGTSVEETRAMLEVALADNKVSSIVLDIESPGGEVTGVPELAERIYKAREEKPIVAVANGFMASAAYWLGSQAREVVVIPSGQVGSVGVYMLHEDWSKNLEQEGIKLTAISAGKYKVEGAPWDELTKEAAAYYQEQVEEVYGWFTAALAQARGVTAKAVRDGYGEGRMLNAKAALKAGLVDRIATLEETIERLIERRPVKKRAQASVARRRLELDDA